MILRKPYGFLIKHFKLIHLIITGLFGYIVFENRDIYKFIKSVIADTANKYNAETYINYSLYIYLFIALLLCGIVYWLLKYKDKPRRIYMVTIFGYCAIAIFLFSTFAYMGSFNNSSIDQKTIRLYKDIMTITLFFQYYIIIFMGIRGLGFDIKKFDFRRDVQELNATSEDGEEIEVNANIDTTNIMRVLRKKRRELGYFFIEYKFYIITILVVIIGITGYKTYNYFSEKYKVYNQNELIGMEYGITIKDSYYNIDNGKNYVIINFDIYKYGTKKRFDTGNLVLLIGDNSYTPNKNICYKFNKLGSCYKKQYITNDTSSYILSYEVDNLNIQDAYLVFNETYDNSYKVKLVMKGY